MIKFDDDVPMPGSREEARVDTLRKMKVGQSFFREGRSETDTWRNAAFDAKRKGVGRFSVRKVEGGIRIWRVE